MQNTVLLPDLWLHVLGSHGHVFMSLWFCAYCSCPSTSFSEQNCPMSFIKVRCFSANNTIRFPLTLVLLMNYLEKPVLVKWTNQHLPAWKIGRRGRMIAEDAWWYAHPDQKLQTWLKACILIRLSVVHYAWRLGTGRLACWKMTVFLGCLAKHGLLCLAASVPEEFAARMELSWTSGCLENRYNVSKQALGTKSRMTRFLFPIS